MKYLLFIFSLQIFVFNATSQITGRLVDIDGKTINGASVALLQDSNNTALETAITDTSGRFYLRAVTGERFNLNISAVAYQPVAVPIHITQQPYSIADISLQRLATKLNEVTIRSQKKLVQQTPEGLVINPANSLLTKGSTALQVLERSPGIVLNKRDNTIELNGRAGVTIMLNGKLLQMTESQLLDLLAGMNGDDIANIELLTTPGVKYDAEGSAGVINITLKKNKLRGTSGNITAGIGYAYREKANAGFNIAHNTAKINLYSSYSFTHNATYSSMFVDSWQDMPFLGGQIHAVGTDTTRINNNSHNATAGLDVKLSAKTTVGANIVYGVNQSNNISHTNTGYNVLPDSLLSFKGLNAGRGIWNNLVASVYGEHNLPNNGKLSASADYLHFSNSRAYKVVGIFSDKHGDAAGSGQALSAPGQEGFASTGIAVWVGKADYTAEFKKIKLESGIKGSYTRSNSYSGFNSLVNGEWITDPQAINNVRMKELVGAAYTSFKTNLSTTVTVTAGLRYEYVNGEMKNPATDSSLVQRRFGSLFPSIFISKTLNENASLQLSYTKRITRPSYNDLASYLSYNDPTAVVTGNPLLQPTITHNLKVGYQYKDWNVSIVYSRDINAIARWQLLESPQHDMLFVIPQNLNWQNNYIMQTDLALKITNWWNIKWNLGGGLRQYKITYTKQPFTNSYWGMWTSGSNEVQFPRNFSAELSGSWYSRGYNGTQQGLGFLRLNLGVKKELKNNKGSLQLSVSDMLRQEKYNIRYGTLAKEAFDIRNKLTVYTETSRFPLIRLVYSKRFGKTKVSDQRKVGSGDEQERIRKE